MRIEHSSILSIVIAVRGPSLHVARLAFVAAVPVFAAASACSATAADEAADQVESDLSRHCQDDGNPCTRDVRWNGQCTHPPIANGTACPDGACSAGVCVPAAPIAPAPVDAGAPSPPSPPSSSGNTLTAASCNAADVQAAINAAGSGDVVVVPNGSCVWSSGVSIKGKGVTLQGQSAAGVNITNNAAYGIDVTEDPTVHTEISRMTVTGSGVWMRIGPHASPNDDGKAVLVHDLILHDIAGIRLEANRGIFYSNTVTGANTLNANLEFVQCKPLGLMTSWTTASTMGTADVSGESNAYVEDNTFTKVLQSAMDIDDNCRVVIRHNVFDNSALSSHGADTSPVGARHFELYDNTFIFTNFGECSGAQTMNLPFFFFLRGGTGVITNNAGFADMSSCAWGNKPAMNFTVMNLQRNSGPDPCWGAGTSGGARYHAPRQIGMGRVTGTGTDGLGRTTDSMTYVGDAEPVYIWGNPTNTPALEDYGSGECTNPDRTSNYLVSGRNFVSGTAKPGWTRFAYPHPMRH